MNSTFLNDAALASVNVEGLLNVASLNQTFQNCKLITTLNLSAWVGVSDSELAFQNCVELASIALPAKFELGDRCFGSCDALRLIDWSTFEGTTAPVIREER